MSRRPRFFAMPRREAAYLLALIMYSLLSFAPWWQEPQIFGMSVFGWLMALLMVLSPLVAILFIERRQPENAARGREN